MEQENPLKKIRTILYVLIGFATIYILYHSYKYLNVKSRVQTMIPYDKDLKWEKTPDCYYDEKYSDGILADYFVCSSSNTPFVGHLKYDYLDLEIIKKTLMAGARYLEFSIVPGDLSDHPSPVISHKVKDDSITTNFNSLKLEEVCYQVKKFAFQSYYDDKNDINENKYPLFIYLDVESKNKDFLNDISNTIKKMWGNRLLDDTYNHLNNDLAHVPICKLFGKIVILTDKDDYIGTEFNDIINYSKLLRIHYNQLYSYNILKDARDKGIATPNNEDIIKDPIQIDFEQLDLSPQELGKHILTTPDHLLKHTMQNLTVVYPNSDDDVSMTNHDFDMAVSFGCQFICMNYQIYDEHLQKYIKIFEKSPLKLKSKGIRLPREKIVKTVPLIALEVKNELQIIPQAHLMFKGTGIGLLPFIRADTVMKHNRNTNKLVMSNMAKPTPKDEYNPNNFDEGDIYIVAKSMSNIKHSICFKSVKYPQRYLVVVDNIIQLMPNDKTNNFYKNSSFFLIDDIKEDNISYYKIISATKQDHYMRVIEDELRLDKYNGEQTFNEDTRFGFEGAKIVTYYSFKNVANKRYLRIMNGGYLTCNVHQIDTSTKFKIYNLINNHFGLLASNNKFLEYKSNSVSATSPELKQYVTNFQLIRQGDLYQIKTYLEPHQKTIYPTHNGSIKMLYDGNTLPNGQTKPKLGHSKFFQMKPSFGIDKKEKQLM